MTTETHLNQMTRPPKRDPFNLPVRPSGAVRFVQRGNRRDEPTSTELTWNPGLAPWDQILGGGGGPSGPRLVLAPGRSIRRPREQFAQRTPEREGGDPGRPQEPRSRPRPPRGSCDVCSSRWPEVCNFQWINTMAMGLQLWKHLSSWIQRKRRFSKICYGSVDPVRNDEKDLVGALFGPVRGNGDGVFAPDEEWPARPFPGS